MSSAAKLRKFGRGTAVVASAALVMTSFGPTAFASWDDAPQTSFVDTTQVGGTIGIVDTEPGSPTVTGAADPNEGNQGATLVQAGKTGQAIGDIRLTLPNRFASGDILDLKLLDRSATENSDGLANQSADTLVGFSGLEGVTIEVSKAMDPRTEVQGITDAAGTSTSGNTETQMLAWSAGSPSSTNPLAATAPSVAPAFKTPELSSMGGAQGKDNLRLMVNNKSEGDPNAVWVVTIKGLKVDLGAKATPGELRVVPFLSNLTASQGVYTASPWFCGNTKEDNNGTASDKSDDTPREIGTYTVPAYVSPVTVSSSTQNIIADETPQSVGDVKIAETQPFSLQNGTYTVDFSDSGADVTIASAASAIKAAITGGGSAESISAVTVANDKKSFSFTLNGADNSKTSTITFSGLMLQASRTGDIAFNITGGSMTGANSWLASPAGTSTLTIDNPTGADIYVANALLNPNATPSSPAGEATRVINQSVTAPATTAPATALGAATVTGIGADDNVLPAGTYTVAADGQSVTGNGITLTADAPIALTSGVYTGSYTGNVPGLDATTTPATDADTFTLTNLIAGESFTITPTVTVTADGTAAGPVSVTPSTGAGSLPVGAYPLTLSAGAGSPRTFAYDGVTFTESGAGTGVFASSATPSTTLTVTNLPADATTFSVDYTAAVTGATGDRTAGAATLTELDRDPSATNVANTGVLPDADYTVSADGNRITGGGVTLTREGSTNNFVVSGGGDTTADLGDRYAFQNVRPNGVYTVESEAITGIVGGTVTVENVQNLDAVQANIPGDYVVTAGTNPGYFNIAGPNSIVFTDVRNGVQVDADGDASNGIQGVTFYNLAVGQTFTIAPTALVGTRPDCGVNQTDIQAPTDEFTQFGSASAGTSAVGGANRFETARKIAKMYSPLASGGASDYAIITSGVNYPDALSSGYLSQRMNAPILLVDRPGLAIPEDTMESLRERGVRKVFVVGGPAAVSDKVVETLRGTAAYQYDEAARNLRPRGGNLEVQRIGGNDRYSTNSLVNMYAAAQFDKDPSIGRTVVAYGQPLKTTAMVARGDNFADALAANILTAGRAGNRVTTDSTGGVVSFARNINDANQALSAADLQKFAAAGEYRFADLDVDRVPGTVRPQDLVLQRNVDGTWTTVATTTDGRTFTGNGNAALGDAIITFATIPTTTTTFALAISPVTNGTYSYASDPATRKGNALPVILTESNSLTTQATQQLRNLHVEHTLVIGSDNAVSSGVESSIKSLAQEDGVALNISTRRLAGNDRYGTAKAVNEYAMAPQAASSDGSVLPGLGYDGGRTYDAATNRPVSGEHTVYLANGGVRLAGGTEVKDEMRFADALVAGPWISAEREAMALTGVVTTPDNTTAFYNENRDELDRAVGLGLGQAVSTKVIEFANKVISGSLQGQTPTPAPTATTTPTTTPTTQAP